MNLNLRQTLNKREKKNSNINKFRGCKKRQFFTRMEL